MTQAVKEKLQLSVVGRDSLLIKTFGESDARLRTCKIVQVGIKTLCDTTVHSSVCGTSDLWPLDPSVH